jgi:hypothetical protein
MTNEFNDAFTRAQALQRRFDPDCMNSFSIAIKYDSYYEEYMEIELRTDNDKFFVSTLTCVYEEDYTLRLDELEKTIDKLLTDEDND